MPSAEVCSRYSLAHALFLPPHCRVTRLTVDIAPRSMEIHCGARGFGAPCQRLRTSPSTAAPATVAGPVSLDAVAGLPCESGGGAGGGSAGAAAWAGDTASVTIRPTAAAAALPTNIDLPAT